MESELKKSRREAEKYKSLYEVLKTEKFTQTSQSSKYSRRSSGRDDEKDEWDGSDNDKETKVSKKEEVPSECLSSDIAGKDTDYPSGNTQKKMDRPYRLGLKYDTMKAQSAVLHKCDRSRIPTDAVIIKTEIRSTYYSISRIEEQQVEYITYRTREGRLITAFYPIKGAAEAVVGENLKEDVKAERCEGIAPILKNFPGTHASVDMLVSLAFNKYMMNTPVYRDMIRLLELKFRVSRQTIHNWLNKGADALKKLLPVLKEMALEKDSIVNCDETWCRVKMEDRYKKAYIWCLVNKAAGIVIFFYDEGSRGRKVLTDCIGESELAALQSDAYNVYSYLDDRLSRVEHICCMAHVRAKFQKAFEQGGDERVRKFIDWIGQLYKFEEDYKKEQLSPEEIKRRINSAITTSLIGDLWQELTRLQDESIPKGDLMQKALNYFMHIWDSVMAYRHDGRYEIDNSVAERSIHPLTIERKNSLFFGSHKGVETSAVYHTFIATCQMRALSFCEFLKKYFTAILAGRTDYENLTPALLG